MSLRILNPTETGKGILVEYDAGYISPKEEHNATLIRESKGMMDHSKPFEFYEIQRLVHSIGIFGLIMLMYKSGFFKWLFALMRPVGQMAFTNYLMQSLLGGLIFYGIGFGMFGKLQRYEIYYVVRMY